MRRMHEAPCQLRGVGVHNGGLFPQHPEGVDVRDSRTKRPAGRGGK